MRSIDTIMKKTAPHFWFNYKKKKILEKAQQQLVAKQ
jgi:hypothetical protein